MKWIKGTPSLRAVRAHTKAHPIVDVPPIKGWKAKNVGANWLCVDRKSYFVHNHPAIIHLKVAEIGEEVSVDGKPQNLKKAAVVLRNGFTFWQLLSECKWASRCDYLPLTEEGLPTDYDND